MDIVIKRISLPMDPRKATYLIAGDNLIRDAARGARGHGFYHVDR